MLFTYSPEHAKHDLRNNWETTTNGHGRVVEHERAPEARVKAGEFDENVDEEAEEFIKLEHKKFELCRWMSKKAG
ncbi:hypothetical protein D5086_019328 [Populus alba]|uniref:Uncharacterized protein n=3 Tax=Populus TaxID=3689 RepID=A0ACC4BIC7_POPAL|nr:hypothetical protein POTOM_035499 [Populus tomentosa]KAJ6981261.1 hypothetical protein NC653_024612 [Populus alba x Populus x berolinensis]